MVAKEELRDSTQCRHFYGYGDPDHVPSILQEITAQRYRGRFTVDVGGRYDFARSEEGKTEREQGRGCCSSNSCGIIVERCTKATCGTVGTR